MLSISKLIDNFYPVDQLGDGFVRCGDELPNKTIHTYFALASGQNNFFFIVSENVIDDDFARLVLTDSGPGNVDGLTKVILPTNRYGFSHVLHVPHEYHSELKGRLDADRTNGVLRIPIHRSEFTGNETLGDFIELRRKVVATNQWNRQPAPKIRLRFDNSRTGGGTSDGYIFARFDLVLREVENLVGVSDGFIELLNYKEEVAELIFQDGTDFAWIPDRDDARAERLSEGALRDRLWTFLTG